MKLWKIKSPIGAPKHVLLLPTSPKFGPSSKSDGIGLDQNRAWFTKLSCKLSGHVPVYKKNV
jgi:hypothetical protein